MLSAIMWHRDPSAAKQDSWCGRWWPCVRNQAFFIVAEEQLFCFGQRMTGAGPRNQGMSNRNSFQIYPLSPTHGRRNNQPATVDGPNI